MSYRFLWKHIASKAIGSAVAKALLNMNQEQLWDRMASTDSLSEESVQRLRTEVQERLREVEEQGVKERALVGQVFDELVGEMLKRRGPR
jgi:hypothetical protein